VNAGGGNGTDAFPDWRRWPVVRAWEDALGAEKWSVDSLSPLNILARRDGSPLFAVMEARGTDPEGKPLLPYVLLRGDASVVVPVCRNRATGMRRFLMVNQRRIGNGAMSLEFPAGMVETADPIVAAARELEEETGLRVEPPALIPLWDRGLCSAPGLSDEAVHFYAAHIDLDDAAFRALEGADAGHAHEGEHITTTLTTFAEAAPRVTAMHPLLGFLLYHRRFGEVA
jgi:8-oxo-dGTP pyrophosphatase MutT (NUDIX family)